MASITIQSLIGVATGKRKSKLKKFLKHPTYVVVDEAHHAGSPTYCKVLDVIGKYKPQALIGLTATPWPSSFAAYQRLTERFPRTLVNLSLEELVAQSILARPVLNTVRTEVVVELDSDERAAATSFDFNPKTLKRLDEGSRNGVVVQTWANNRQGWGKTLVFALNIEHADRLQGAFAAVGADVRVIHSKALDDRRATLDWFRSAAHNPVLISVGMLTEGVDLPDARTAFLVRPTASRILLRQMIGRVPTWSSKWRGSRGPNRLVPR